MGEGATDPVWAEAQARLTVGGTHSTPTPATMATELRGGGEWLRWDEMRGVVSSEEPGDET